MNSDINRLRCIFDEMRDNGFDTNSPLKWGFFFFDKVPEKLMAVVQELDGHGYVLERLERSDEEDWVLEVSKVETLSCDRLHRRNLAFNDLADFCGVALYDGWDVGRAQA